MYGITIDNLTVKFRAYRNQSPSLKEAFAKILNRGVDAEHYDFVALNSISLKIMQGDRVGIIGRNGAGKSTLLKSICNVYESDRGVVNVSGKIAPLLEIGAGFHPEFTGRENIYFNGSILGYKRNELKKVEREIIDFAEVSDFIDMPVKYYSTGMYMKLAFSLATAMQPDILILDEMFAGGDVSFVTKARKRIENLIDNAKIMLLVSHDTDLILSLCNRIIWLDKGCVVADGSPHEVMNMYMSGVSLNE